MRAKLKEKLRKVHYIALSKRLFFCRHSNDETIHAATVSYEHALLAFTVIKEDMYGEIVYNSLVAEIQPEGRVFDLNLESSEFRRLQFVHMEPSQRPRHGRQQQQLQSCLLVVCPNNFAAIYTFKIQCIRTGYVVLHEPDKEVLCSEFHWYQWDPSTQWLYLAQFESSGTRMQSLLSGDNSIVLHCYSFAQHKHDLVLTVALPLPYTVEHYLRGETYYTSPLALVLPVQEINMQVLYLRNGLWCACLQHGNGVAYQGTVATENGAEKPEVPEGGKLDYTIFIFNNGHTLHMQVPLPMPVLEPLGIHFMVLSGFLVAYIPNFLLHILNVGPATDPCHHLAFGVQQSPMFPVPEDTAEATGPGEVLMSPAITTTIQTQKISTVLENRSGSHFEVNLNIAAFLELFKTTESVEMMEDLLHLTIVGLRHHGMALAMVEHVCQSPLRLGDHRLFSEFLLSFAFANTIFDARRYVSKQLPLTLSPTFCGKVFKNDDRVTFAMLRLNPIRKFTVQLLVQSDQRLVRASPEDLLNHEVGDKPFEMLCYFAVTSQPSRPRINILQEIESQDKHSLLSSRPLPPTHPSPPAAKSKKVVRKSETVGDSSRGTLLDRLSQFTRSSFQQRGSREQTDGGQQDTLPFLEPDEEQTQLLAEEKEILVGVMTKFMSAGLQSRSKNTVATNVRFYVSELEKQSCLLLRLIWESLGFNADSNPLCRSLYNQPTTMEEILFERLEAYHLALQEVCFPTPSGFHTLFASLGFICLSDTVFLQYLRNGVFVPTKKFIELLLYEVDSDREQVVYEVVCNANPQLTSWALQTWQHPTIKTLLPESTAATEKKPN